MSTPCKYKAPLLPSTTPSVRAQGGNRLILAAEQRDCRVTALLAMTRVCFSLSGYMYPTPRHCERSLAIS